MPIIFNSPESKLTRRQLRKDTTAPENKLWQFIRGRRFQGIKFRRQHGIGRYIVDFYCPAARLAIEIDGGSHAAHEAKMYDAARTEYLENCGIRIIRFTNEEIAVNIEEVLKSISKHVLIL